MASAVQGRKKRKAPKVVDSRLNARYNIIGNPGGLSERRSLEVHLSHFVFFAPSWPKGPKRAWVQALRTCRGRSWTTAPGPQPLGQPGTRPPSPSARMPWESTPSPSTGRRMPERRRRGNRPNSSGRCGRNDGAPRRPGMSGNEAQGIPPALDFSWA